MSIISPLESADQYEQVNKDFTSCCLWLYFLFWSRILPSPSSFSSSRSPPTTNTAEYLTYEGWKAPVLMPKKSTWQSSFIVPVVSTVIYCLLTGRFSRISALISQITSRSLCWENLIVLFVSSTDHRSLRGCNSLCQRWVVQLEVKKATDDTW